MLAMDRPAAAVSTSRARRRTLIRSALITAVFIAPAVVVRIMGLHPDPVVALLIFGTLVAGIAGSGSLAMASYQYIQVTSSGAAHTASAASKTTPAER